MQKKIQFKVALELKTQKKNVELRNAYTVYKYINKCMCKVFRPVWVRPEAPATKTETNISE